ncbi:MAG: triacylglycerol lipase [Clostridia bacterium]|jgi:triacylglycerol lipase
MVSSYNCKTKYPIVLIHGTGFKDRKHINYWGRIPQALKNDGATVFYGYQDAWGTVENNAVIIRDRITEILDQYGCEKVNLIAHSKGGMESRYAISTLGMADKIASLTTIATPHKGSKTIDVLHNKLNPVFKFLAFFVNKFFMILGDREPDFYTVTRQFSTPYTKEFNKKNPDSELVYYQSYAAVMKNSFSDITMVIPHSVVGFIEGENDGLVTPESAAWTNFKGIIKSSTNRGISHADEVDLRRKRFTGKTEVEGVTDIVDVYIKIVSDLKDMGY